MVFLSSVSEPDSLVSDVVNSIIRSVKHISQNPERTGRCGDVHAHDAEDTLGLSKLGNLRNYDSIV